MPIPKLQNGKDIVFPLITGPEYVNHWKPEGFTNEQHHADFTSISSSKLSLFTVSPYAYLYEIRKLQNGRERKQTKSMRFGTIAHLLVLEPSEFRKKLVIQPHFERDAIGKKKKALWYLEQPRDAVIFENNEAGQKDYERFIGVVEAIASHPIAKKIFKEGVSERSGYYRDPVTGFVCKFRPDFMSTIADGGLLPDFKTSQSIIERDFQASIVSYNYHIQNAMYREGYKQITGAYPKSSPWVVIENSEPYEVAVYEPDPAMLSVGYDWYRYCLDHLFYCLKNENFPQKQRRAQDIAPPEYLLNRPIPVIGAEDYEQ